ncbi:MAG: glycoside hydrolase family 3 C-terminal domain-containing protein [Spirochaetales bacterium]|nr:glycoside hydrolase family 3 C-terminal domain-containing protein [Spirochaetales bacterium]
MKKRLVTAIIFIICILAAHGQVYKDPNAAVSQRVSDLLARMSLAEKIGQMTQANLLNVTAQDVRNYLLGSVLSGGGSVPSNNTPQGWADTYDNLQNAALSTPLGIPIIYGVDAVHGHNNVGDAVMFPHNIGLGAANDPDLMERIGEVVAREVAATGVDWTFGPCVAVVRDERWGRTYEGFAEDPSIHDRLVRPFIRGLQGTNMQGERIVACAKHFIADGGTQGGVNMGDARITESELRNVHLPPYIRAIEENVGTVMISFSSWNGTLCHASTRLVTEILKNELGFQGFVVSDWNAIRYLSGTYSDQIRTSVNAGIDMFMVPEEEDWQPFISELTTLVQNGRVSTGRIDDAVRRILTVKFKAGLFEHPLTDRSIMSSFGGSAHRQVAREAVRKSLVLLKNNGVLPLSKNARLLVAGRSADSMRNQCGGWTLGWQGMLPGQSLEGTTILQGIRAAAVNVTYSSNGSGASGYDAAIVVVGEEPYAEAEGDDQDLSLSPTDIQCINNVESSGTPYVIVLVSGRPMTVTSHIESSDAFVAAWLPGTEGGGVADCLFGDHDFSGKLPFSWPRSMSQIPVNYNDPSYDPLYAFGYGLSLSGTSQTTPPTPPPGADIGDVNNDGSVNIVDALLVAQYYVGLNPGNFDTDRADANCNGNIDIVDALLIAQYYVGLISGFC